MISTRDVSRLDYLRNRPFLVIEIHAKPPPGTHTERQGWAEHAVLEERPAVVARISDRIMRRGAVIIDLWHDRVVKNRLSPGTSNEQALAYFKTRYADMVHSAMRVA